MSSPGPVMAVVMIYLAFVLKIGPEYMKNRKPMDLKRIMVFYNAFQVCYSIWMCHTVSTHGVYLLQLLNYKLFLFTVHTGEQCYIIDILEKVRDKSHTRTKPEIVFGRLVLLLLEDH